MKLRGEKGYSQACLGREKFSNKRGQVTIFIIVAVVVVVLAVSFFIFRDSIFQDNLPASIEPVYNTFLTCLEEDALVGIGILGRSNWKLDFLPQ